MQQQTTEPAIAGDSRYAEMVHKWLSPSSTARPCQLIPSTGSHPWLYSFTRYAGERQGQMSTHQTKKGDWFLSQPPFMDKVETGASYRTPISCFCAGQGHSISWLVANGDEY